MEYSGKVAVITGGAGGIGRALAEKCLDLGLKVVLADVSAADLANAAHSLKSKGEVLTVQTDVAKPEQVNQLADTAFTAHGAVHLLFNNAGVSDGRPLWQSTPEDWHWVFGVNVMGIGYAIQSFVPRMIAQDEECWVVNTASLAGLVSGSGFGIYRASKHAVVSLSETLHNDLRLAGAKVRVAALCPAWVKTDIVKSARNRPVELGTAPMDERLGKVMYKVVQGGIPPAQVAEKVFEAIQEGKFYILTHPEMMPAIHIRHKDVTEQRPPRDTFAEAYLK